MDQGGEHPCAADFSGDVGRRAADGQPPCQRTQREKRHDCPVRRSAAVYGLRLVHAVLRDYRKKVSAKEPEYKAYVCNRYASGGKNACSSHYINQKVLTQIVMTDIRCKAMWAQNSRETLRTQLLAREQSASVERTRTLQAELNAIGKRLPELDKLIQSAYEDKVLGRIPESVCVNLLNQYEAERREKQERYKELTGQLAASRETESSVDA